MKKSSMYVNLLRASNRLGVDQLWTVYHKLAGREISTQSLDERQAELERQRPGLYAALSLGIGHKYFPQ